MSWEQLQFVSRGPEGEWDWGAQGELFYRLGVTRWEVGLRGSYWREADRFGAMMTWRAAGIR